jgi:DNA-binding NtrC family response regulator
MRSLKRPIVPYHQALEMWKRKYFLDALDEAGGHQGLAADLLGIHRNTMNRLLQEAGLTRQIIRQYRIAGNKPITTQRENHANRESHA